MTHTCPENRLFGIFFDNFVQNSFENAEQIGISEGKKVENSKEIFLFKIHSKRYENVFEGLRDHQIHKTSNLPSIGCV